MKIIIGAFVMALMAVCLAVPGLVSANVEETAAAGSFTFIMDDGETKFVEFKASGQLDGQAAGEMTFSDPSAIFVEDPDSSERPKTEGVIVRAKFDCMDVLKNTAVIGGQIFESNVPSAIGLRVLLVVEDNGLEGSRDRLAWGIFRETEKGWLPTDAERDDDKGAELTWHATDAERRDDQGIPMGWRITSGQIVGCRSFPLATFDFPDFKYGGGDMQVR